MNWTEIRIKVDIDDLDRASDIASMVVPYGFYIEDYSNLEEEAMEIAHIDLIDEDLLNRDRTVGIIHIYISPEQNPSESAAYIEERFKAEGIRSETCLSSIREEDWANNWKQYFKPMEIGEKLMICPTWEEPGNTGGRKLLRIDPGMAFGSGTHATTSLCMEMLERYIRGGEKVLDIGTGSGILAIASLLLGAGSSLGVDIDKTAVRTAVENGELNGFTAPQYTAVYGDLADRITGKFDVVVANIVADVIIRLSETVQNYLADGGVFIMSGIVDIRLDDVKRALAENGFKIVNEQLRDGWACLAAV